MSFITILREPLPSSQISCHHRLMKFVATIQRALCTLAMLGVLIGPVSIGIAESAMASNGTSSEMTMPGMDMATETAASKLPCCPEQKQAPVGCAKDCPLALVCGSMLLVQAHEHHSSPIDFPWVKTFAFFHVASMTSATIEPPARPPRA